VKHYFIPEEGAEISLSIKNTKKLSDNLVQFTVSKEAGDSTYLVKKIAGKLFWTQDEKSWKPLANKTSVHKVFINEAAYDWYRGYKPSGLNDMGGGSLVAKIPGKVTKLLVKVGDQVEEGQTVLVLEAMKMENELKAGQSGTISGIHVSEGQTVESGVLMVEISDE